MTVEWRRHVGGRRIAHAFRDGECLCNAVNTPGHKPPGQFFPVSAWEPADVSPQGVPYRGACANCLRAVQPRCEACRGSGLVVRWGIGKWSWGAWQPYRHPVTRYGRLREGGLRKEIVACPSCKPSSAQSASG